MNKKRLSFSLIKCLKSGLSRSTSHFVFCGSFSSQRRRKSNVHSIEATYAKTTTRCIVTFDPAGSLQRDVDIDIELSFDPGTANHGIFVATSNNTIKIHFTYDADETQMRCVMFLGNLNSIGYDTHPAVVQTFTHPKGGP